MNGPDPVARSENVDNPFEDMVQPDPRDEAPRAELTPPMAYPPQYGHSNGMGTDLLFFRQVSKREYVATICTVFMYLPIVPLSTWLVRPGRMFNHRVGRTITRTAEVAFLRELPTTVGRIIYIYLGVLMHLLSFFGAFILAAVFRNPLFVLLWAPWWIGYVVYLRCQSPFRDVNTD
jgi:hypothetical protein